MPKGPRKSRAIPLLTLRAFVAYKKCENLPLNTHSFRIMKSVPLEVPITLLTSLNGRLGEGGNELGIVMLVDLTNLFRLA